MRPVAQIAQSVEQGIENPRVGGSIPSLGTKIPKNPKEQCSLGFFIACDLTGFRPRSPNDLRGLDLNGQAQSALRPAESSATPVPLARVTQARLRSPEQPSGRSVYSAWCSPKRRPYDLFE